MLPPLGYMHLFKYIRIFKNTFWYIFLLRSEFSPSTLSTILDPGNESIRCLFLENKYMMLGRRQKERFWLGRREKVTEQILHFSNSTTPAWSHVVITVEEKFAVFGREKTQKTGGTKKFSSAFMQLRIGPTMEDMECDSFESTGWHKTPCEHTAPSQRTSQGQPKLTDWEPANVHHQFGVRSILKWNGSFTVALGENLCKLLAFTNLIAVVSQIFNNQLTEIAVEVCKMLEDPNMICIGIPGPLSCKDNKKLLVETNTIFENLPSLWECKKKTDWDLFSWQICSSNCPGTKEMDEKVCLICIKIKNSSCSFLHIWV